MTDCPSKRAAAQMLLDTLDTNPHVRLRACSGVMDRLDGKPRQSVTVEHRDERGRDQLLADNRRMAGLGPEG